jgi:hypothetical protein
VLARHYTDFSPEKLRDIACREVEMDMFRKYSEVYGYVLYSSMFNMTRFITMKFHSLARGCEFNERKR